MARGSYLRSITGMTRGNRPVLAPPHVPLWGLPPEPAREVVAESHAPAPPRRAKREEPTVQAPPQPVSGSQVETPAKTSRGVTESVATPQVQPPRPSAAHPREHGEAKQAPIVQPPAQTPAASGVPHHDIPHHDIPRAEPSRTQAIVEPATTPPAGEVVWQTAQSAPRESVLQPPASPAV